MDEKRDKEVKETIDKLLSDIGVLLQIVAKIQDLRYLYLTNAVIDTKKFESELDELDNKLQIIDILG